MSVIGEAILSAIIDELVKVGFELLVDECKWRSSIKSELLVLKKHDLPRIRAVVEAAEAGDERLYEAKNLQEWLRELKDALYEADDVLDKLKYIDLQKQVEADHRITKVAAAMQQYHSHCLPVWAFTKNSVSKMKSVAPNFSCGRVLQSDQTLRKLRNVIENLRQVAGSSDLTSFYNMVKDANKKQHEEMVKTIHVNRVTTAIPTEAKVYGRVEQKRQIIWWLMHPEDDLQLLSVVGHGGMGKTTLAKFVLEDESVNASFELVMWAYVSPSFDHMRIIKEMLASTKAKKPDFDDTLVGLQTTLTDFLKASTKKFLLVLDDAWEDQNHELWQNLLAPLRCAGKGGRIILTTRSGTVAQMAEQALDQSSSTMRINLSGLDGREYLELFYRHAFSGKDKKPYPQLLWSIGQEIANKLGGSPLLAKVVGSMLNKRFGDTEYWRRFRDHRIPDNDIIMSNLRLSYHYLPSHLRPCFAYCSVLPRYNSFRKQDVVRMWIAVGLIQEDSSSGETMESKGGRYFDELLERSILELNSSRGTLDYPYCDMHDLLYELAQSVAGGECFTLTDDQRVEQIPKNIRHLHIHTSNLNMILKMEKLKSLRTLIIYLREVDTTIMNKIFESLGSIRVLVINIEGIGCSNGLQMALPNSIGGSRHLRYVQVDGKIDEWPRWLSKLYNLQTIKLTALGGEPDIKGLINLRHWDSLRAPPGFGKLTSLQELKFYVSQEPGLSIGELKGLAQLRELSIIAIENVSNSEEAREAMICEKKHMRTLSLCWAELLTRHGDCVCELQEKVIEELRPNSSLERLTIENYVGIKRPSWMDARSLKDITSIELRSCSRLVQVSPLGNLECLMNLYLGNMPEVKRIGPRAGFRNLQVLEIMSLEQLEQWDDGLGTEDSLWCPCLRELDIQRCPKLIALPSLPPSLKCLHLERLPVVKQIDFEGSLPQLETLWFSNLNKLEKLCGGGVNDTSQCFYPALKKYEIYSCDELNALPALPLCLERLSLHGVGLTSLPKLWPVSNDEESSIGCASSPSSSSSSSLLSTLLIHHCPRLTSLATSLLQQQHHLGALSDLEICDCEELVFLPAGGFRDLCSLKWLTFSDCHKLQLQPYPETTSSSADHGSTLIPLSLESLTIDNCGGSIGRSLPRLLEGASSLSDLKLKSFADMTSLPSVGMMAALTSLRTLAIEGCHELTSLGVLSALRLDSLEIGWCPKLLQQPRAGDTFTDYEDGGDQCSFTVRKLLVDNPLQLLVEPLRNLTSVEDLRIGGCRDIQSLAEVNEWLLQNCTFLGRLRLSRATSLPACILSLSSLHTLELFEAKKLQSLPQLPFSLKRLEIVHSSRVLKERLRKDVGADWPHIEHIPHIRYHRSISSFLTKKQRYSV